MRHISIFFRLCKDVKLQLFKVPNSKSFITNTQETKTPLIKKWARYWEDLIKDYTDVLKESCEHCKKHPLKSSLIFSFIGLSYVSFKLNPDEVSYRDCIIKYSNDVVMVGNAVRSSSADQFLTSLETCHNLGVFRRLNFGVGSIMWIDDLSNELGIYKSNCKYLKPKYLSFNQRIVDIGFFGKWWRINSIMKDYDVNLDEWKNN